MYEISESDFQKLETDMHTEMTRLLRRFVMIRKDEPAVPEKRKRGRPKKEKS